MRLRRHYLIPYITGFAIICILFGGLYFSATGGNSRSYHDLQEGKPFTIAMTEGVQSANPFIGIYDSDYMLYSYLYDCLMYPNQDGNATPNLAKGWWYMDGAAASASGSSAADLLNRSVSDWPLGSIWEYNLSEGVTWSDGGIFDADDVVFTIALQTGENYPIFWAYQPYTKWIDHAQKVDQYKVRFFFTDRTNSSKPAVPVSWGSSIAIPMMPEHVLKNLKPVEIAQSWNGIPTVGTGPFVGTDQLQRQIIAMEQIVLLKNPEWEIGLGSIWNRTCDIDRLIMKLYSDEQTLVSDLKEKKIDVTKISPINYISLQNATDKPPELELVSAYSPTVYTKISHFYFEQVNAPGRLNPARADPAIHRACALATDRDYIVSDIFKGLGTKGVGMLTPAFPEWYYDAYSDYENISWFNVTNEVGGVLYSYHDCIANVMGFNITRANEILNASGYTWPTYPTGFRTIGDVAAKRLVAMGFASDVASAKVDLKGNPRYLTFDNRYEQDIFEDRDIAKYLGEAWKNIGVEMVDAPNTIVWDDWWYHPVEFYETYWSGDPDPNYLLYVPSNYSMDGWNEWGPPIYDPDGWNESIHYYDYCYKKQAQTLDKTERIKWVHECEKYLFLNGAAYLTTCNPKSCYAYLESHWTNWGDWAEHPGLSIEHYWGETPILMKVKWSSDMQDNGALIIGLFSVSILIATIATVSAIRKRKRTDKAPEEEMGDEKGTSK